jgi:lysine 2,3-aminomutase
MGADSIGSTKPPGTAGWDPSVDAPPVLPVPPKAEGAGGSPAVDDDDGARGSEVPSLRIGERSREFRARAFPQATDREWNDWRWQMRNRIRDLAGLERVLRLSDDERDALRRHTGPLPVGVNPYYAALLDPDDPRQALRRTVVAVGDEYVVTPGETRDPLAEDAHTPVDNLVHRYPDRVLLLATGTCPVYCRYCTRSRMVGAPGGEYRFDVGRLQRAVDYIAATPSVRDVLISGGDPLSLSDDRLDWLLTRLRRIPHVEFVRIGSKMPATTPQRITPAFARMLRRHQPVWMSIHFTHPDELTPEVEEACNRLADAGIPLGSQTVLLAGVNDDLATLKSLFHGLLKLRVRPYYLYQCDPVVGTSHFRVPVRRGLELVEGLRGHTTGYAVPTYVVDAPGGGGKVPLFPETVVGREGDDLLLRNYEGKVYRYPDPIDRGGDDPARIR